MLTLQDFIKDYQHAVVAYPDFNKRMNTVDVLIQIKYVHIYKECYKYIKEPQV